MPKTMKAAVVRQFKGPLSIDEVPVPEVGRGQILVKSRHRVSATPTYMRWTATGR